MRVVRRRVIRSKALLLLVGNSMLGSPLGNKKLVASMPNPLASRFFTRESEF